jgi:hypothetical protein
MIYIQIRDSKNNVLDKPKTMKEAVRVAEKLRDKRKETITIWNNEPVRITANFWQYGYHNKITFDYEKKFLMRVDNGDWEKINVETEEQFNNLVVTIKKYNPDINIETKIE